MVIDVSYASLILHPISVLPAVTLSKVSSFYDYFATFSTFLSIETGNKTHIFLRIDSIITKLDIFRINDMLCFPHPVREA